MILVFGRRGFVLPMKSMVWLWIEDHTFGPGVLGSCSGKVIGLLAVLGPWMEVAAETQILIVIP